MDNDEATVIGSGPSARVAHAHVKAGAAWQRASGERDRQEIFCHNVRHNAQCPPHDVRRLHHGALMMRLNESSPATVPRGRVT
ncbi:hypothetical protein AAFF_G00260520 [Aldrovandia affinis]|uniref:Uncharacterized protein n=1 Tax=Aldrovandia affinis TaxID=143900 RepID=A0AAD7W3A8_9TELE|nr:hypothetical protein AAFF_G00260520 [Aldrovandia affinis]